MEAEEEEEAAPVTNALLVDHGLFRFESQNENIFLSREKKIDAGGRQEEKKNFAVCVKGLLFKKVTR